MLTARTLARRTLETASRLTSFGPYLRVRLRRICPTKAGLSSAHDGLLAIRRARRDLNA